MLIPMGMTNAIAQETPGQITSYTLEEIEHSFAVMEEYVIYNENKNITFDIINATANHDSTQLDIDIALDFAIHNNDIMDAVVGPTGQVNELGDIELQIALQELVNGKFRALFEGEQGPVGSVNEITFTTYDYSHVSIISAFGISEYSDIYEIRHRPSSSSSSLLACGGSTSNPHPWNSATIYPSRNQDAFDNYADARSWAFSNGYHIVSAYATDHFIYDFAKTDTSAPSGCNSGEFREQAVMTVKNSGAKFNMQHDEPNPELLNYSWPKLWWGPYVAWWHDTDGETKP